MRTNDEIQGRIRQLLTQELEQRVQAVAPVLPVNCRHNVRHPLDVRRQVAGESNSQYNQVAKKHLPVIGLCMLGAEDPTSWPGTICEDPIDAQTCPVFENLHTRQSVQDEFQRQLKDQNWVKENLPEVSELLWVLELDSFSPPKLSWWGFVWLKIKTVTTIWSSLKLPRGG